MGIQIKKDLKSEILVVKKEKRMGRRLLGFVWGKLENDSFYIEAPASMFTNLREQQRVGYKILSLLYSRSPRVGFGSCV